MSYQASALSQPTSLRASLTPRVILMLTITILFFFLMLVVRLWPSHAKSADMLRMGIGVADYATITSAYYLSYAVMQIPVALALDRWSPRFVITALMTLMGASILTYEISDNFYVALLARFFLGFGSAGGLLGLSKVIADWLPKHLYGRVLGPFVSVGLLGLIAGGAPVGYAVAHFGMKNVVCAMGWLMLVLAGAAFLILKKSQDCEHEEKNVLGTLKYCIASPRLWVLGLGSLLMVGVLEGFADLWGKSYVILAFGCADSQADSLMSSVFFGLLVGTTVVPFIGKYVGQVRISYLCGILAAAVFAVLFSAHGALSFAPLFVLLFLMGTSCGHQVSLLDTASTLVPKGAVELGVAFVNCMNMLGGVLFHKVIGKVLSLYANGAVKGAYSATEYAWALAIVPLGCVLAAILLWMSRLWLTRKATSAQNP